MHLQDTTLLQAVPLVNAVSDALLYSITKVIKPWMLVLVLDVSIVNCTFWYQDLPDLNEQYSQPACTADFDISILIPGLPVQGKLEPLLTEVIFSQMMRVPNSHLKPIAYATILVRRQQAVWPDSSSSAGTAQSFRESVKASQQPIRILVASHNQDCSSC